MKRLVGWKVVSAHSKNDFDIEVSDFMLEKENESQEYLFSMQYQPLVLPNGKILYSALVEVWV